MTFIGKVLATATGIAVYELTLRPAIAGRFERNEELEPDDRELERAIDGMSEAELETYVESERILERARRDHD